MSSAPSPPFTADHPPTISPVTGLPFWNTHLPTHLHTPECPSYLTYAFTDHRDRANLATYDKDYVRASWPAVQSFIRANRLDGFRRVPSDLRKYRESTEKLVHDYGSVMDFVMRERLRWTDLEPESHTPFACSGDYKILLNDWPYGIDTRITHFVVWTKFELTPEPITPERPNGDLTPEARRQIDDFVTHTFGEARKDGMGEKVVWFKNWSALKSVHAVEHFHVMMLDADPEFVREITHGDVALADKVKGAGERRNDDRSDGVGMGMGDAGVGRGTGKADLVNGQGADGGEGMR